MELNQLMSGGGGMGVELDDDSIQWSINGSRTAPKYKDISLNSIPITSTLTDIISIDIPQGKKAILLTANVNLSNESSTRENIKIQLELDGKKRVNEPNFTLQAGYGVRLVGHYVGGEPSQDPKTVSNIVFRNNLTIRLGWNGGGTAAVTVSYILVK